MPLYRRKPITKEPSLYTISEEEERNGQLLHPRRSTYLNQLQEDYIQRDFTRVLDRLNRLNIADHDIEDSTYGLIPPIDRDKFTTKQTAFMRFGGNVGNLDEHDPAPRDFQSYPVHQVRGIEAALKTKNVGDIMPLLFLQDRAEQLVRLSFERGDNDALYQNLEVVAQIKEKVAQLQAQLGRLPDIPEGDDES